MAWWQSWSAALMVAVGIQAGAPEDLRASLNAARQKWEARKPSSYEFTVDVKCFCVGIAKTPPSFRVVGGKPSVIGELVGESSQRFYEHYNTVERLFDAIERSLTRGRDKSAVQYDGDRGFPAVADLDPLRNVADDELYLLVTNFRVIEKAGVVDQQPNIALPLTSGVRVVARLGARSLLEGPRAAERGR